MSTVCLHNTKSLTDLVVVVSHSEGDFEDGNRQETEEKENSARNSHRMAG